MVSFRFGSRYACPYNEITGPNRRAAQSAKLLLMQYHKAVQHPATCIGPSSAQGISILFTQITISYRRQGQPATLLAWCVLSTRDTTRATEILYATKRTQGFINKHNKHERWNSECKNGTRTTARPAVTLSCQIIIGVTGNEHRRWPCTKLLHGTKIFLSRILCVPAFHVQYVSK
jgi:hypothetical protein